MMPELEIFQGLFPSLDVRLLGLDHVSALALVFWYVVTILGVLGGATIIERIVGRFLAMGRFRVQWTVSLRGRKLDP